MEILKNTEQWSRVLNDPSLKNILNLAACYPHLNYENIAQQWGAEVMHYEINKEVVTAQISPPANNFLIFPIIIASNTISKPKYYHLSNVGLVKSKYYTKANQNEEIRIYIPVQENDKEFYYARPSNTNEGKEIASLTQEFDMYIKQLADKMANENASLNKEYMEIQSKMRLKKNENHNSMCECCHKEFILDFYIEDAKPICKICAESAVVKKTEDYEKYYKAIALHNLLREKGQSPLYSKNANDFTSEEKKDNK